MPYFLERIDVKHGGRVPLPFGTVSIGRGPGNTVALPAEDCGVSAYHAVIYADPRRMLLQDLRSTNGTFVNGRQAQECVLRAGDEVGLGRHGPRFRVTVDDGGIAGGRGTPMPATDTGGAGGVNVGSIADADAGFEADAAADAAVAGPAGARPPRSLRAIAVIAPVVALTLLAAFIYVVLIPSLPKAAARNPPRAGAGFFSAPAENAAADAGAPQSESAPLPLSSAATGERINAVLARFGEEGYSAPPEMAERVEHYLGLYRGAMRRTIALWMERGRRYFPMIRETFAERNVPLDLAYVSMLESGFSPVAVSHAGAAGLWQFMPATARHYGLRVDGGMDERTDPEKATRAAAAYFKDLIAIFGSRSSVLLCMAAYNAGEQRVINALKRIDDPVRNRDFWYLYRMGWLPRETNEYIPQVLALIIISDNPEEYGFGPKGGDL
jgi:soluble lytic murein transglycosylase-like protein